MLRGCTRLLWSLILLGVLAGLRPAAAQEAPVRVQYWREAAAQDTFRVHLRLTNMGTQLLHDWSLSFDLAADVKEVAQADWSAAGRRVTLRGVEATYALLPGKAVWVSLSGTYNAAFGPPSGCVFDGVPCTVLELVRADDAGGDPDPADPADLHPHFRYTSVWDGGYVAQVSLVNEGDAPVNGWSLAFSLPAGIGGLWNGSLRRRDGRYVVEPLAWNRLIAPGDSAYFGFQGGYTGTLGPPADCTVNGAPCTFTVSGVPETPDDGPAQVTVQVAFTSVWAGGYVAAVTLTNVGTSPLRGWEVGFDFAAGIGGLWNGALSRRGGRYYVRDVGYNALVAPGASTVFGFQGSYAGTLTPPTGCTLNDAPCDLRVEATVVAREDTPEAPGEGLHLAVYPQPWPGGPLTVHVTGSLPGGAALTLYDAQGRLVPGFSQQLQHAGRTQVLLPETAAGTYWLVLQPSEAPAVFVPVVRVR